MKFLKYLFFLLLIVIIGLAIYIAVQPNDFNVTRTRTINAPAPVVYNHVNDYKNWEAWSPWIEKNPSTKLILPDQTKGVGGSYSWEDEDGFGKMTTIDTEENVSITQEMQFEDFPPSTINWNFESNEDGSTDVTWTMKGDNLPFGFKAYTAFTGSMEEQVGPDFTRGLELLDSVVVADMKKYSITVDGITQHSGGYYLYNTASCKISEIDSKMMEMMPKLMAYAEENNINIAGAPFTNYLKWDEDNNATIFSSCIPTTEKIISTKSDILTGQLEPFKAVKTTLRGNYDNLPEAWDKAMEYIPQYGLEFADDGPMLETYVTDSSKEPNPANWVTEIYIAVK